VRLAARVVALALAVLLAAPAAAAAAAGWAEGRLQAAVREIEPTLRRWGYPVVAGVVALDYVGVPVPADTMLVAATIASTRGDLRVLVDGIIAVGAMIVGSQMGFGLGRWGGRALLRRLPISPARMAAVEARYVRWGTRLVPVAPFIDGVRQLNAFAVGMLGMAWWRFTAANVAAAFLWTAAWVGATLLIQEHVAAFLPALRAAKPWLFLAACAGLAGLVWRLHREPPAQAPR
jgi:membrane protein DedA with SNARE-associated domain